MSPIAVATTFVKVDQVMKWMKDNLTAETEFGFGYVDYGDPEDLIPSFPAVIITNGPTKRTYHGTHTFLVEFMVELWVLHANLAIGSAQRRFEDIQLCNLIQDFFDSHINLDGNIIQGWVSETSPGVLARKGVAMVATRMTWEGIAEQRFR